MSFDGNGTYTLPSPQYPAISGQVIYADDFNTIVEDLASALSLCMTVDGQANVTADLPMANHKLTGLSQGAVTGDSVEHDQVFINGVFTGPKATATANDFANDTRLVDAAWVNRKVLTPTQNSSTVLYAFLNIPQYP